MDALRSAFNAQRAVVALVLLAIFFAGMNVIARYLSTGFDIYQQTYLRAGIAFLMAVLVFWKSIRWRTIAHLSRKDWAVLIFRGTIYFLAVALAAYGAIHTQISHVAFISAAPFVPLLAFLLLRERMTWWKILFTVGSCGGIMLIAVKNLAGLTAWNLADLVVVLSTLLFALSFVARKWHSPALNNKEITTFLFLFGALSIFLVSIGSGGSLPEGNWTWKLLGVLFATGVINIVGMQLLNFGFGQLNAIHADNLLTLKVAFGVLFGYIFYQELPGVNGLIGGSLIVASVIGMNIHSGRAAKFEATEQVGGE